MRDRLLGDGEGLFLRVRPHGTATWVIECPHQGQRKKYTRGQYIHEGACGNSIEEWLDHRQLSLTQVCFIGGAARMGGVGKVAGAVIGASRV